MFLDDFSKRAPAKYSIKGHNGYGTSNCIACGDRVEAFIRINEDEIIEEIEFVVMGGKVTKDICDITLRLAEGKNIFEFYEIDKSHINIPRSPDEEYEFVTYEVGLEAISSAIKNYFDRKSLQNKTRN